jgi:hypothetical protein
MSDEQAYACGTIGAHGCGGPLLHLPVPRVDCFSPFAGLTVRFHFWADNDVSAPRGAKKRR